MLENFIIWSAVLLFAAWLTHYLRRRARRLSAHAPPREGTFLAGLGVSAHLRDFYRLAIALEGEGVDFYLRLSEAAQNPDAKALCIELARQEVGHKRRFQAQLDQWQKLPPSRSDWPVLLEHARKAGFFASPPPAAADEKELVRYALSQEALAVKFYDSFQTAFPEAWRREKLAELADEERAHEQRLRAAYPGL